MWLLWSEMAGRDQSYLPPQTTVETRLLETLLLLAVVAGVAPLVEPGEMAALVVVVVKVTELAVLERPGKDTTVLLVLHSMRPLAAVVVELGVLVGFPRFMERGIGEATAA